jgi:hypothetical protein
MLEEDYRMPDHVHGVMQHVYGKQYQAKRGSRRLSDLFPNLHAAKSAPAGPFAIPWVKDVLWKHPSTISWIQVKSADDDVASQSALLAQAGRGDAHGSKGSWMQVIRLIIADFLEVARKKHSSVHPPTAMVLTPFRKQRGALHRLGQSQGWSPGRIASGSGEGGHGGAGAAGASAKQPGKVRILVDTIECAQGSEADLVVLCLCPQPSQTAFALDPRRLTVALSRSRRKLIVVATHMDAHQVVLQSNCSGSGDGASGATPSLEHGWSLLERTRQSAHFVLCDG